jgi:hypothetical protein
MRLRYTKSFKGIALLSGAFCAASLLAPAMSRADEINVLKPADVEKALNAITAGGTRAGAADARVHIMPTPSAALNLPRSVLNRNNFYGFKPGKISPTGEEGAPSVPAPAFPAPFHWSPLDLVNNGGNGLNIDGITSATQANIYLNCNLIADACWGSGLGSITHFQDRLNTSTFIHIVDQYVGSAALSRYPRAGYSFEATGWTTPAPWGTPTLLDSTAQALVDASFNVHGLGGYGVIFHIFVRQGTDVCMDSSFTMCYSPDNPGTFMFCGYHSSFTDGNGNHLLYTVEPYDPVAGCMIVGMSKTDAQVNVLSHETFETITDPDPNTQWNTPDLLWGEIGDACAWNSVAHLTLSGFAYNIQEELTNVSGTCWKQANN